MLYRRDSDGALSGARLKPLARPPLRNSSGGRVFKNCSASAYRTTRTKVFAATADGSAFFASASVSTNGFDFAVWKQVSASVTRKPSTASASVARCSRSISSSKPKTIADHTLRLTGKVRLS